MKANITKNSIKDVLLAAMIGFLIFFIGILLFPYILIFFPVPFVILTVRRGYFHNMAGLILSMLCIFFFVDVSMAIWLFFVTILFSMVMGYMIQTKQPMSKTIYICSLLLVVIMAASYFWADRVASGNLANIFDAMLRNTLNQQLDQLNQLDTGGTVNVEEIRSTLTQNLDTVMVLLPGLVVIYTIIMSLANYYLAIIGLQRLHHPGTGSNQFADFHLPQNITLGIIFTSGVLFVYHTLQLPYATELILNVIVIFAFLFAVQGLAVGDFFFKQKRGLLFRLLIPALLIIFLQFITVYIVLGILDIYFNFRHKLRRIKP